MDKKFRVEFKIKEFCYLLRDRKKQIIGLCILTTIFAIIVAFSIPRIYKARVVLAPETSNGNMASSISSLASMIGLYGNNNMTGDAIYPEIYPEIFNSTEFITELYNIKFHTSDSKKQTTLYEYMKTGQKSPWWNYPLMLIKGLFASKGETQDSTKVDPFHLTREQYNITRSIQGSIFCAVDKKTSLITLEVTAQDPLVAAVLTDSVKNHLQDFITQYRTKKACNDLDYMKRLYVEAKNDYTRARQLYASYSDANQDLQLASFRMKATDLENDMQLKYNIYTQVVQQVQLANAKVQENTPAFTVVQNPVVPIKHSNKPKILILAAFLLIAYATYVIVLIVRHRREVIKVHW